MCFEIGLDVIECPLFARSPSIQLRLQELLHRPMSVLYLSRSVIKFDIAVVVYIF